MLNDKITNVHDKFFKSTFGDIEVATDFLNNYLPMVEIWESKIGKDIIYL